MSFRECDEGQLPHVSQRKANVGTRHLQRDEMWEESRLQRTENVGHQPSHGLMHFTLRNGFEKAK